MLTLPLTLTRAAPVRARSYLLGDAITRTLFFCDGPGQVQRKAKTMIV